jgi:hypothetical protein
MNSTNRIGSIVVMEIFYINRWEIPVYLWSLWNIFRPPLWSSVQRSWLQIQRSRIQFSALLDFLRSSGSWTESTQHREDNWGAISRKYRLRSRKPKLMAVGIRYADHATPSIRKSSHWTTLTSGGRSVGIVCLRTIGDGVSFVKYISWFTFPTGIQKELYRVADVVGMKKTCKYTE